MESPLALVSASELVLELALVSVLARVLEPLLFPVAKSRQSL